MEKTKTREELESHAKELETTGNWEGAALVWLELGYTKSYDACMLIYNAVRRGDDYRAELEQLGPQPDAEREPRKYIQWLGDIAYIYNKHFGY